MEAAEVKAVEERFFSAVAFPRRDGCPRGGPGSAKGWQGCRNCNLQRRSSGSSGGLEVRAGVAGRGWEEGMCVVERGLIRVLGLAFIVQEEKRNQEKYKAFHTLMKCETSRVIISICKFSCPCPEAS